MRQQHLGLALGLIDSALLAHDLVFDPLGTEERARHYAESKLFAGMLGIPRGALPPDYGSFGTYVKAMCRSNVLTVSTAARGLAAQIFDGGGTSFHVPASYMALTAGILPERLRTDFGFVPGSVEVRAGERLINLIRSTYFAVPQTLRYIGPYHEACQRLAGRRRPGLATRLSNRFWTGQSSLGSWIPKGQAAANKESCQYTNDRWFER